MTREVEVVVELKSLLAIEHNPAFIAPGKVMAQENEEDSSKNRLFIQLYQNHLQSVTEPDSRINPKKRKA